jgi:hypothetical protein
VPAREHNKSGYFARDGDTREPSRDDTRVTCRVRASTDRDHAIKKKIANRSRDHPA